jgi:hypothetical protein
MMSLLATWFVPSHSSSPESNFQVHIRIVSGSDIFTEELRFLFALVLQSLLLGTRHILETLKHIVLKFVGLLCVFCD